MAVGYAVGNIVCGLAGMACLRDISLVVIDTQVIINAVCIEAIA